MAIRKRDNIFFISRIKNGQQFTEDIVDAIKDNQNLEDDEGTTVESRVISTSVKMLMKGAGRNAALVRKVFYFFAIFPEDVAVPASFFTKMLPILVGESPDKKAGRWAVGTCLSTLLKYNLIKGSLAVGHGVFQHDIVRDFVINEHSSNELRALQKAIVDTVLASRPEPDGFPETSFAAASTFEGYTTRQMYWHQRGALEKGNVPPDEWLMHDDLPIRRNTAVAVGLDALVAYSNEREAAGNLAGAALAVGAGSLLKDISLAQINNLTYRALNLLERADSEEFRTYESAMLSSALTMDMGSARHAQGLLRLKKLASQEIGCEARIAEVYVLLFDQCLKSGFYGGAESSAVELMPVWNQCFDTALKAGEVTDNEMWKHAATLLKHSFVGFMNVFFGLDEYQFERDGEKELVEAIDAYEYHTFGPFFKRKLPSDLFLDGVFTVPLALLYGNLNALETWRQKAVMSFEEIDLTSSGNYSDDYIKVTHSNLSATIMFLLLGKYSEANSLLSSCGFTSDKDGWKRMTSYCEIIPIFLQQFKAEHARLGYACLMYLAAQDGTFEDELIKLMPSPATIAAWEQETAVIRRWLAWDLTSLGAQTFLKLGRDDDAAELARLALSPEQKTESKLTLSRCHSMLGQVAAKRGDLDEADGHFASALREAKLSRFPMLEVLMARDWEEHGRDCTAARAAIDASYAKMGKTAEC